MKKKKEKQIKKALKFYLDANKLKYKIENNNQSAASRLYGRMILAIAINSEYDETKNIGKTLKILLLKSMMDDNAESLHNNMSKLNDGKKFYKILTSDSKAKILAQKCINREKILEYFFEVTVKEKNIFYDDFDKIYELAEEKKIPEIFGNNKEKNYEIFRFYYLNRKLKFKERTGWDNKHWNVQTEKRETVAEHVVGTIALALGLNSEFDFDIDIDKVIYTLAFHEIGEIKIGDITPFDNISPEEKEKREHEAIKSIVGNLRKKDDIVNLLFNFDKKENMDSKIEYLCDKLEADLQSKIYQDLGYHNPLSEQGNNIVFTFDKTKKMVEEGAQTAFDIWYLYDKDIYKNNKKFSKVLKYAKKKDLVNKGE